MMRKLLTVAGAATLMLGLGLGSAIASTDGHSKATTQAGKGGNECPPSSPQGRDNPGALPPCGNAWGVLGGMVCPPNSPAGQADRTGPPCGNGNGNGGGGGGETTTCPPATGPVSGNVVQPISDGIRNGGGGQLADVVDQVNCQLVQGTLGL